MRNVLRKYSFMKVTPLIILCVALLGFPMKSMNGTGQETFAISFFNTEPQTLFKTEPQTIEEQILAVLIDSGYSICEQGIILAQSKHESGHYTNSISKKNNIFSLYKGRTSIYPLPDKARAEGCMCFATYRSIQDATLDYLQLRNRLHVPQELSIEEYVKFIKRKNYFMDNEERYLASMIQLMLKDEMRVTNFNKRYPGCPREPYTSEEISSKLYPSKAD